MHSRLPRGMTGRWNAYITRIVVRWETLILSLAKIGSAADSGLHVAADRERDDDKRAQQHAQHGRRVCLLL